MLVQAIWEMEVDVDELDKKCVEDIDEHAKTLVKAKLDYLFKTGEITAEDFEYEIVEILPPISREDFIDTLEALDDEGVFDE